MPLDEGVFAVLPTGMSLLRSSGCASPVRLLPILLLETPRKGICLSVVALPAALAGGLEVLDGRR